MGRFRLFLVATPLTSAFVGSAFGQAFNVDVAAELSSPASSAYGGVSGQVGLWNTSDLVPLRDIDGSATPVRIGGGGAGGGVFGFAGSSGDEKTMMESVLLFGDFGGGHTVDFRNVEPGWYNVFVYAWGGMLGRSHTLEIGLFNGVTPAPRTMISYTPTWPGRQVEGETYIRLSIEVYEGVNLLGVSLGAPPPLGFQAINGIQVVPIPAPGLAAFPLAVLAAMSRRRR